MVQHVPDSARHFALGYLMKVPVANAAILNVFCLSVWLVDTCLGASSYTLTDLSPPPIPPPHPTHPSLTTSPLGFVILPRSPPSPIIFPPPSFFLTASYCSLHFPPVHFPPFVSPLFSLLHIHTLRPHSLLIFLPLLFIFISPIRHLSNPSPSPLPDPPVLPRWKYWSCPWHISWRRLKLAFSREVMRHATDGRQLVVGGRSIEVLNMRIYCPFSLHLPLY